MHTNSMIHVGPKDTVHIEGRITGDGVKVIIGPGGEGVTLFLTALMLDELEAAIRAYHRTRKSPVGVLAASVEGDR